MSVWQDTNVCSQTLKWFTTVLCFKLDVFAKALAVNALMGPSSSLQKFLYHPGDSCEAKWLMARLSWRHLGPVRLRLLFKAQPTSRHTVHACLQLAVCGALNSSATALCLPCPAKCMQIDFQEHIIFLPQYLCREDPGNVTCPALNQRWKSSLLV